MSRRVFSVALHCIAKARLCEIGVGVHCLGLLDCGLLDNGREPIPVQMVVETRLHLCAAMTRLVWPSPNPSSTINNNQRASMAISILICCVKELNPLRMGAEFTACLTGPRIKAHQRQHELEHELIIEIYLFHCRLCNRLRDKNQQHSNSRPGWTHIWCYLCARILLDSLPFFFLASAFLFASVLFFLSFSSALLFFSDSFAFMFSCFSSSFLFFVSCCSL